MPQKSRLRSSVLVCACLLAFAAPGSARAQGLDPATAVSALSVAPGFKVDLLYAVPKEHEGSWVSLTVDSKGRLIAADQYGSLYRVTLPAVEAVSGTKVEKLAITLPETGQAVPRPAGLPADAIGAHGLLYAFDSLYVMVNEVPGKRGLWRLRDTQGRDQFDEVKYLRHMEGGGEHGTHSLVLSPDGKSIYFANGNHTDLPENLEHTRAVRWGEDHLLPRMWDANGHAKNKFAPGGYIGRTDPDGKSVELFASGFRNQFDLAFDQNGELFTYDSDMEWDQGAPWYMPTRVNHVVDGGDYGWRSGAGRWPDYYADSLPASLDVGPGSPTGVTFGTGAKFPAQYQRALFAADWTYGTLYAVHLTPDGATFRGEREEVVAGKPLPLTDLVVNPRDGALYFVAGGRRTQSALYRLTYTGRDDTSPAAPPPPTAAVKLRHELEALHADGTGPEAIAIAWPHLGDPDRFIRFAARVALERQLPANWAARALAEKNPVAAIEALIALARVGESRYQPQIIEALSRLDIASQPPELRLPLLRAWQLTFTRMGKPDAATCARLAAKFDPLFPAADALVNRELVSLLVYLDSPTAVAKTVPLLRVAEPVVATAEELGGEQLVSRNDSYGEVVKRVGTHRPDRQQIAYAYALRCATAGWTTALREEYFAWFARTASWRGGASFAGFLRNIRQDALAAVPDPAEAKALAERSKPGVHNFVLGAVGPKGPGRAYTVDEAMRLMPAKLAGRNFAQGQALFSAAACVLCHRFNGEGAGIGPDISGAGNRYSVRDLLENIIEPSKVISDQYGSEVIELTNGDVFAGRVVAEENGQLKLMSNPFEPDDLRRIDLSRVKSRKPSTTSLMPPGLINELNPDELQDLVAYVLSGGNQADAMFRPAR